MQSICVYCGSSNGARPDYAQAADDLANTLYRRNLTLVYGGASVGIMGRLADAMLDRNGKVVGVMPQFLVDKEIAHPRLTQLHVVETMHDRKLRMAQLADGFIAMPGGLGTLEEIFEVITWGQLGLHAKPCGFLNVCGYFDHLIAFLQHTTTERFVKAENRDMLFFEATPAKLLARLEAYQAPKIEKWLDSEQT